MFQGLLPVDKPVGLRSSRCVELVKGLVGKDTKVGHGGTLDSSASGMLVLLLGGATRASDCVMSMPKTYTAVVRLGAETTTCDYTGHATSLGDFSGVRESDIDEVIPSFIGWRMQVPPEISAVHVNGRRAHKISRAGGKPEIPPRPVFVESIRRTGTISADGDVELLIRCGKGTYVRSLARDIGRRLGCLAHIVSLRRLSVGPFSVNEALAPDENFLFVSSDELISMIRPLHSLERFLPRYSISAGDAPSLLAGREVPFSKAARLTFGEQCPGEMVMICSGPRVTIGNLAWNGARVSIVPRINIAAPETPAAVSA
jgi:tRNA pseudouridine(55) synthase